MGWRGRENLKLGDAGKKRKRNGEEKIEGTVEKRERVRGEV